VLKTLHSFFLDKATANPKIAKISKELIMKKTILLLLVSVFVIGLFAQTASEEAIQSLDNAKNLITQKNYAKAQDEINFALSKISEIQAEDLIKFIPDAPTGWKQNEKTSNGLGQAGAIMGSANAITAKGEYSKGDEQSVSVTISIGGMLGKTAGFMGLGALMGGSSSGSGSNSKSVRIAGYTGTTEYDAENKDGKLTIQVGEKISVTMEGNGLENGEVLKTFAAKMDLAKLEKAF
jgi:hypothetical protein